MSDYEGYINSELTNLRKQNASLKAQLAAKDEALRLADDYILLLENCQDGYYRAEETEEALKYKAALETTGEDE